MSEYANVGGSGSVRVRVIESDEYITSYQVILNGRELGQLQSLPTDKFEFAMKNAGLVFIYSEKDNE